MGPIKHNVLVYEKQAESLEFLRHFFSTHKRYMAAFVSTVNDFKNAVAELKPNAVIAGSPSCIDSAVSITTPAPRPRKASRRAETFPAAGAPVIAMVSRDVADGLKKVIRHGLEHYISPPYFDEDLEYKLQLLIGRSELLEKLYQEKTDAESISELTYLISTNLDPQQVLYIIVKKLSELISASRCSILSVECCKPAKATVVSTFEDPSIKRLELDLKKYPEIERAIVSKQSVIIKDALKDPLMKKVRSKVKPLDIRSIVVIPVTFHSEVIGTLFLRTSKRKHHFTDREIGICKSIAEAASKALYNAFLFEEIRSSRNELHRMAITDFLTGLYNIRYVYHRSESEISRAMRYKHPLGCMMLDIDHFKRVNDNYGHRTGDRVLREFADLINGHTRKSDVFARYGGEEFIMLLPQTPLEGVVAKAVRIAKAVRNHKFGGIDAKEVMTISIGVSAFPDKRIKTHEDLIRIADKALIKAKKEGRDKVITG